jgi:hypothetical protein
MMSGCHEGSQERRYTIREGLTKTWNLSPVIRHYGTNNSFLISRYSAGQHWLLVKSVDSTSRDYFAHFDPQELLLVTCFFHRASQHLLCKDLSCRDCSVQGDDSGWRYAECRPYEHTNSCVTAIWENNIGKRYADASIGKSPLYSSFGSMIAVFRILGRSGTSLEVWNAPQARVV